VPPAGQLTATSARTTNATERLAAMPQGTIKTFDQGTRSGSLVLDDLTELTYDTNTFTASRLLELRVGQRVRFDLDGAGADARISNLQIVSL
jgi:2-phospho-L-lactate guanylyltransferase